MLKETLVHYIREGIEKGWEIKALSNYMGKDFTYREIAILMARIHLFYRENGITEGDKVALIGKNSVHWAVVYLATVTYGAIVVPLLPDFRPEDIQKLVDHSDSKILFSEKNLFEPLDSSAFPQVKTIIDLEDFSLLQAADDKVTTFFRQWDDLFQQAYPEGYRREDLHYPEITNDKLAVISYTSGTTGNSKGVMLSHNSLAANVRYAHRHMPLNPGDRIVSFLPLAHAYGCAFEFLFPFTLGCHITFLTKTPSPKIITKAFAEIRPRLILSVPLVIEKIYKKQIVPSLEKPTMRILLKVPLINKILYNVINKKIYQVFGGNFRELIIGGAAFNPEAEIFFNKIKFPFTVGYGMSECGPLISYASWNTHKLFSCGRPVDTLEVKIDSDDPENEAGEILVKGDNVMDGYYKNEKATREVLEPDGWLHTGDLGTMDKEQNIFIRGRSKNMILGPSGQNIYPEEIEAVLNNNPLVSEALVVGRDHKVVALIYPDFEQLKKQGITTDEEVLRALDGVRKEANKELASFMQIYKVEIMKDDFQRTPKRNIKRVLYK
ncbi:MAG: AMP-binding protein [Bacteroidales bacterium]|nr:AMP-binding protein [Bacteroidales bacterium]